MKKFKFSILFAVFFLVLVLLFLSGCSKDKGLILFNSVPITQNNALHDQKVFSEGGRVYYLFIAPKKMKNKFIRVQIFKMIESAPWGGNDVVVTKDFRLMKDQRYYHTDYFTLNSSGRYVMQIFSIDDLQHPLALDFFYVR